MNTLIYFNRSNYYHQYNDDIYTKLRKYYAEVIF